MKNNIIGFIIILFLIFQASGVKAQQTITIGTGTSAIYTLPVRCSYDYGWTAVVYPQSLLQNTSGNISKLAYNITNCPYSNATYLNQKNLFGNNIRL